MGRLSRAAAAWVRSQRRRHRPAARLLSEAERRRYRGCFRPGLLSRVRLRVVATLPPPPLRGLPAAARLRELLQPLHLEAITFMDTLVLVRSALPPVQEIDVLVYHELVHAAQYDALGVDAFVHDYLDGWVGGGFRYDAIPLERRAFSLEARYRCGPPSPWRVARFLP